MIHLNEESNSSLIDDLLFLARYTPKALFEITKHGMFGAILGWASSYGLKESWNTFATKNHEFIDPEHTYKPNSEQFMGFPRNSTFNKDTPVISDAIPVYAAVVGAAAGGFFAAQKILHEVGIELKRDRDIRRQGQAIV